MPALRPRLRRIARNEWNLPGPVTRGRGRRGRGKGRGGGGGGTNTQDPSPATISWHNVPMRTNKLVDYLVEHPPDCAILFATETSKKSNNYQADLGHASGKDKGEIYSVIANHVFHNDATYESWYATNPIKFLYGANSVIFAAKFESTGAGIVPIDSETSDNLHRKIEKDFPWYNDLYRIWGSNPSFSAKMSSSKPGANHAGDLFALTLSCRRQFWFTAVHKLSPPSSKYWRELNRLPSANGLCISSPECSTYWSCRLPPPTQPPSPSIRSGSQRRWRAGSSPQWSFSQATVQAAPLAPPLHLTCMPLPPTFSREDYSLAPPEFNDYEPPSDDGPLADGMEDLHMDDMDDICHDENMYNLDSPPKSKKARGKKRQLPLSPTPSPPQSVAPLPRTSNHDSRSSFKSHANQVIMHESASSVTSSSRASSGRSNPSSPQQVSPTSQTSFSERASSRESVKKCIFEQRSRNRSRCSTTTWRACTPRSLPCTNSRTSWLMVKLNANRQDKEHHLLREERAHERMRTLRSFINGCRRTRRRRFVCGKRMRRFSS
ncbi:hypothetical protein DFJ58DRAFT_838549 [Suillus subalutaceus]|uniref:uncharacterized protein n=1 Tax=Suillus subalutaceus TaxID=48586 RepID=UPI001B86D8BD|nr:uncharacterized protein DFJ58DRAFT_838549 [Suillus subalutaceus]KAG1865920.1 hypothetical protein DFJ58DRAFT_838549 [Suillus subalutaceus]